MGELLLETFYSLGHLVQKEKKECCLCFCMQLNRHGSNGTFCLSPVVNDTTTEHICVFRNFYVNEAKVIPENSLAQFSEHSRDYLDGSMGLETAMRMSLDNWWERRKGERQVVL